MGRTKKVCLTTFALLLVATPAIVQAQNATAPLPSYQLIRPLRATGCAGEKYKVASGDRLYNLYGPGWDKLLETNPGLKERTSLHQNVQTVVMIYPEINDTLCIPAGMSVRSVITNSVTPAPTTALYPAGCSSASGFSSTTGLACSTPAPATMPIQASVEWYNVSWLWIAFSVLIAVVSLLIAYRDRVARKKLEREAAEKATRLELAATDSAASRAREMLKDPITSGTPYVPGGIAPTETARLENFFDAQAENRFSQRNPGHIGNAVRPIRIGPIEMGTITGEGLVGYLGSEMLPRSIATPIRAYQARYRFPDGSEEILQSLMGCMNPVSHGAGEVYRGFIFALGQIVIPAPPAPPDAPTQLAIAAPVVEILPTVTPANDEPTVEDGVVKLEIRHETEDQPAMVRMSGVDETANNTCEIRPGIVTLRYVPRVVAEKTNSTLAAKSNTPLLEEVIRETERQRRPNIGRES